MNDILGITANLLETVDFDEIADEIGNVADYFIDLAEKVQSGEITIEDAFDTILDTTENLLIGILEKMKAALPEIVQRGRELIAELCDGMREKAPEVYENTKTVLKEMLEKFLDALPEMLEAGGNLLLSVVTGIRENKVQVIGAAVDIITEFGGTILEHLPEILETGIKVIGKFIAGIISQSPQLLKEVMDIISDIVNKFLEYDWGSVGKDILKGLANGILSFVGTVVDAAREAAGEIAGAFKDFFDIHSPSRMMRDEVGKQITLGIAEGILAKKEYAKKSADELSDTILKSAKESLSGYKTYNDLALADEAMFWDSIRIQAADGTQARIDADKEYFEAKKKMKAQMEELENWNFQLRASQNTEQATDWKNDWKEGLLFRAEKGTVNDISPLFENETSVPQNAGMSDMFLDAMLQALSGVQIVLEDGVLVGKLSPKIDRVLGGYTKTKERYYV